MGTEIGSDKGGGSDAGELGICLWNFNLPEIDRFKNREHTLSIGTPFMAHRVILRP